MYSKIYVDGQPSDSLPYNESWSYHEYCNCLCVFDAYGRVFAVIDFRCGVVNFAYVYRYSNRGHGRAERVSLNKSSFNRAFYRNSLHIYVPNAFGSPVTIHGTLGMELCSKIYFW